MALGYIYILTSPKIGSVKIGGTDYPPLKRIKEINYTEPYKSLGPWSLADFRQVTDWPRIEYNLHYIFRSKLDSSIKGQKELFTVSQQEASLALEGIDPNHVIYKPKIDRMFQDEEFLHFIVNLFKFSGLLNWLDIQGAWTFVLFPSTNGGRYFTINIGGHEVAFSTLQKRKRPQMNMLLVDKLILDFPEIDNWIYQHNGAIKESNYETALPRATSLIFEGTFNDTNELLSLDGVRRALIAYWNEALIKMKENSKLSLYSKFHNWNAIAKIYKFIRENN